MKHICAVLFAGVALFAAGCASLTPEEISYQQKFTAQPTEFELPKAEADEAWARALTFVTKYSDMKVDSTTDTMIKSYLPTDLMKYGYSIVKMPVGDKFKFTVDCLSGNPDQISSNNAHIAALFIATGTEPLPGTLDTCFHVSCR
jgi:hypothetical protein